jgi:hypothetical protein
MIIRAPQVRQAIHRAKEMMDLVAEPHVEKSDIITGCYHLTWRTGDRAEVTIVVGQPIEWEFLSE